MGHGSTLFNVQSPTAKDAAPKASLTFPAPHAAAVTQHASSTSSG
jgi:hypothetical protein